MPNSYITRPIRDAKANRICTLAGLNEAYKDLVTLRALDQGIELAVKEVEAAKNKAELIDNALVVARFTKAACDAFISIAAELSKSAKTVSDAYKVGSVAAGAVGDMTAGKPIDKVALTIDIVKAGSAYAGPQGRYIIKSTAIKASMVVGAMNEDQGRFSKSVADYTAEFASLTLEGLEQVNKNTKIGARAGLTKKLISIGKSLYYYDQEIGHTLDQFLKDKEETQGRFASQKHMFIASVARIRGQMSQLEEFVVSCEAQINETLALPPPT